MSNKGKNRTGVMYSTNQNFEYHEEDSQLRETPSPQKQLLKVITDSKMRNGKTVTIIEGFVGKEEDMLLLGKLLKSKCGVGGSVKDGQIIIQGDFKNKIIQLLKENNYRVK